MTYTIGATICWEKVDTFRGKTQPASRDNKARAMSVAPEQLQDNNFAVVRSASRLMLPTLR